VGGADASRGRRRGRRFRRHCFTSHRRLEDGASAASGGSTSRARMTRTLDDREDPAMTGQWKPEGPLATPYRRARQEWDARIGSAAVQAKNWRLATFVSLG